MNVTDIIEAIENVAPLEWQEDYDNAGLQVGDCRQPVDAVLVCLDVTEDVLAEAARKGCNLIVSHHPLIFSALRQVAGQTFQQRCVEKAIKNDIAIYCAHTNLDNAKGGVNFRMAQKMGLGSLRFLEPKLFEGCGSGLTGVLPEPMEETAFLEKLKSVFGVEDMHHNRLRGRVIEKVALCGGAGSFLIPVAMEAGADAFVTGEISYHTYFDADGAYGGHGILLAEMGHYESERFTVDLLSDIVSNAFPHLRIEKTELVTNPVMHL
ncbi:MAG: Nif3-like dinuclear metal center hexameric protein [Bacteroidales bacterium]|nr:Nif3-like dinuclear metal center hexameric protein [Candidatus Cacconaster caballi]